MKAIISVILLVLVGFGLPALCQTNATLISALSDASKFMESGDLQRAYDLLLAYQERHPGTNDIERAVNSVLPGLKRLLDEHNAQEALWSSTNGAWFIEAEFSPGFSSATPWRLRVHSSGAMEQLIGPPPVRTNDAPRFWTHKSLPPLSLTQVVELERIEESTHLATLTNNYSSHIQIGSSFHSVSDLGSICLASVSHGVTNRVCFSGPEWLLSLDGYAHKEDVRRFLRLWIKVLEMARFSQETINGYGRMLGQ